MIAEVMAGNGTLGEFLDVFLVSTAERINQICRLLDCGDLHGAGREAHTLLGTAGNCGAMQLSGLAAELRAACDEGDHALAKDIAGRLGSVFDPTSKAVLAWLAERREARAA
jgi:HPt (histidine-containing phosphotransfer) domain-containing protein